MKPVAEVMSEEHLEALVRGERTVEDVAASTGLEVSTVMAARDGFWLARRRKRRGVLLSVQLGLAVTVTFLATHAISQVTCSAPAGWNPLLRVMCANGPALAEDVNANFQRVHDWLVQRTGALDAGVTLVAPTLTAATVTGPLTAGSFSTSGTVSFGGSVGFDGGITVNDVVRAQALQTTLYRSEPATVLNLNHQPLYQSIGLSVTFTLDESAVVDFQYNLSGSLSSTAVAFVRLNLNPTGELTEARGTLVSTGSLAGRALRQLPAGTYTATVDVFLSPGATLTINPSTATHTRALLVHVMGVSR